MPAATHRPCCRLASHAAREKCTTAANAPSMAAAHLGDRISHTPPEGTDEGTAGRRRRRRLFQVVASEAQAADGAQLVGLQVAEVHAVHAACSRGGAGQAARAVCTRPVVCSTAGRRVVGNANCVRQEDRESMPRQLQPCSNTATAAASRRCLCFVAHAAAARPGAGDSRQTHWGLQTTPLVRGPPAAAPPPARSRT